MGRLRFDVSQGEALLIDQIVDRVNRRFPQIDKIDLYMDLICTHLNGCELLLDELLKSSDGNFYNDVFGIRAHLNRHNGKLGDHFWPRHAKEQ